MWWPSGERRASGPAGLVALVADSPNARWLTDQKRWVAKMR